MHIVFKLLLSFVLAFTFVYVEPRKQVQTAQAVAPLAAWAVGALGSIVLDVAIDAGIDFIDEQSKTKWKDKKVGEIWNKYGDTIKDLKPTKKNAKEWALKVPKWLMAAIVDEVGDTIEDTVAKDTERKTKNKTGFDKSSLVVEEVDPLYKTGISVTIENSGLTYEDRLAAAYVAEWHDFYIKPIPYAQKSTLYICLPHQSPNSNNCEVSTDLDGDEDYYVKGGHAVVGYYYGYSDTPGNSKSVADYIDINSSHYKAFKKYLSVLSDKNMTIYYSDGILATKGNQSTFNLPDTIYDGNENREIVYSPDSLQKLDETKYPMIAEREYTFNFGDDSNIIDADFEVIDNGDDVDWEIIERDIEQNVNNYNKTINYDYEPVVNNYYTVSDPEEIKNDIEVIINNDITIDNGGNNSISGGKFEADIEIDGPFYCVDKSSKEIVSCKEIEAVDGSLLQMAKNAYQFAATTVKTGAEALQEIAKTGEELSELFGLVFGWLPSEIRALLIGGFSFVTGLAIWRAFRR